MIVNLTSQAVIRRGNEILLTELANTDLMVFPFGEVRGSEDVLEALRRDLKNELGGVLKEATFIGVSERRYKYQDDFCRQVDMVFAAEVGGLFESKVPHLAAEWVTLEEFEQEKVIPKHVADAVRQWLKDGKTFWTSVLDEGK